MRVHHILISHRWNFLAEGTLRSLPPHVKPFLIHNGKTSEFVKKFSTNRELLGEYYAPQHPQHGQVVDLLWEEKEFRWLLECDALVMLDHDCWFPIDPFLRMEKQLLDKISEGCVIVGTGKPPRRFFTTYPMFAIKPVDHWPCSWILCTHGKRVYDMGQWVAAHLPVSKIDNVHREIGEKMHWHNDWQWINNNHHNQSRVEYAKKHYVELITCGVWNPCEYELCDMNRFDLLKDAVCAYRERSNT